MSSESGVGLNGVRFSEVGLSKAAMADAARAGGGENTVCTGGGEKSACMAGELGAAWSGDTASSMGSLCWWAETSTCK